jgi:hypothetical protein
MYEMGQKAAFASPLKADIAQHHPHFPLIDTMRVGRVHVRFGFDNSAAQASEPNLNASIVCSNQKVLSNFMRLWKHEQRLTIRFGAFCPL